MPGQRELGQGPCSGKDAQEASVWAQSFMYVEQ